METADIARTTAVVFACGRSTTLKLKTKQQEFPHTGIYEPVTRNAVITIPACKESGIRRQNETR